MLFHVNVILPYRENDEILYLRFFDGFKVYNTAMHEFRCTKCGCTSYVADTIQTTGGNFSKFFDVQNKKFVAVSCTNCGYTELYRQVSSTASNVIDFFIGH